MNAQQLFAQAQAIIGASDDPALAIDERDFDLLAQVAAGHEATMFEKALATSIARAVVSGTYKPSRELFMQTANLGKTGHPSGYVHFRGIHVEHYSFSDFEEEATHLARLEADCIALLEKGFLLTARTAICPLHAEADAASPWPVAMSTYYTFFQKEGMTAVLFHQLNAPGMRLVASASADVSLGDGVQDAYTSFHILQNAGWKSVQPQSYARFKELIKTLPVSDKEIAQSIGYEYARIGR